MYSNRLIISRQSEKITLCSVVSVAYNVSDTQMPNIDLYAQ